MELIIKYYFQDQEDNDGMDVLNLKDFEYPDFDLAHNTQDNRKLFFSDLIKYLKNYKHVDVVNIIDNFVVVLTGCPSEKELKIALSKMNKYEGFDKYGITDSLCPLCNRQIPEKEKSKHHLIPVAKNGNNSKKVVLHRICHVKIHSIFNEDELAMYFNTIEKLTEHEEIVKFVKWLKNKPNNFYDGSKRTKFRRD